MTYAEAIAIAKSNGTWREYGDCTPHPTRTPLGNGDVLVQNEDASDCWMEADPDPRYVIL